MATGAKAREASGNSGTAKRIRPYPPVFRSRPARITLPAVGASVCASGSHVCSGNAGSFTAKAAKNPSIRSIPTTGDTTVPIRSCRANVQVPVAKAVQDGQGDDGDEHEQAADLREEEELHGGLVAVLVSPDVDEEVHRDEHELPEEDEQEEVRGEEHAVDPGKDEGEVEVEECHPRRDPRPGGKRRP